MQAIGNHEANFPGSNSIFQGADRFDARFVSSCLSCSFALQCWGVRGCLCYAIYGFQPFYPMGCLSDACAGGAAASVIVKGGVDPASL
jgi:hypothetical protein